MKGLRTAAVLLLLLLLGAAAVLELGRRSSEAVRSAAEAAAGEDPYCLQVSGGGDYGEVRDLSDLSIFNMRVSGARPPTHHAVLAVDRMGRLQLLHWSYGKNAFVPGALGPPPIYCTPRAHDLATLGTQPRPRSTTVVIRVDGMTLSIPRSFAPHADGNSHGITFYARSPGFEPLPAPPRQRVPPSMDQLSALVSVAFGQTGFLRISLHKNDASYRVEDAGTEMGLNKQLVWYLPSQDSPNHHPSIDWFTRSADGEIDTLIHCDSVPGADCMHSFHDRGWTYTFHHGNEHLGEWKDMHARLSALARSFVTAGTFMSVPRGIYESHRVEAIQRADAPGRD